MTDLLLVALASLAAGCIDAIVGGGGLVLVPALFAVHPAMPPATLLGTNKAGAVWGTAWAAAQYARRVVLPGPALAWGAAAALAGSAAGAWAVTGADAVGLRRALPIVLAGVLAYTLSRKDLGRQHAPRYAGSALAWRVAAIGAVIGSYDGAFGPGTGSFFVFLFVRLLGFDFLHASACAKLLNTATNLAALALFAATGHVLWATAVVLAVANVAGSIAGTRLALRHGAGFVRTAFIIVVAALIARTGYDAFLR